jgi:hypothetical protein
MNSCIKFGDKKFDIKRRVILYDEPEGISFLPKKKFGVSKIPYKQLTIHWSATYRSKDTFNGLNSRGLSVNFIIDDDPEATIFQTLDMAYYGWSQGSGCNSLGPGVELSYQPGAWEKNYYTESLIKKYNVQPHEQTMAPIHGTTLEVFLPTEAQMQSLFDLTWGICELLNIPPKFPRDNKGNFLTTNLRDPSSYKGLLNHYNITRGKIDTAGLDLAKIENEVETRLQYGF